MEEPPEAEPDELEPDELEPFELEPDELEPFELEPDEPFDDEDPDDAAAGVLVVAGLSALPEPPEPASLLPPSELESDDDVADPRLSVR